MLLPWRRSGVRKRLALASLLLLCCARCSAYVSLPPEVAGAVTQLGTSLAGGGAAAPAPQPQPAPGGSGFGNVNAALGLSGSNAGRGKGPSAKGASGPQGVGGSLVEVVLLQGEPGRPSDATVACGTAHSRFLAAAEQPDGY